MRRLGLWTGFLSLTFAASGCLQPGDEQRAPAARGASTVAPPSDDRGGREDGLTIVRGSHPRQNGLWIQYNHLTTALRGHVTFSDVLTPGLAWQDYLGRPIRPHDTRGVSPENFDNLHNHYQNLLSEVINFMPGANAVAIWGDAMAADGGAKVWGGFFSARSSRTAFSGPPFDRYTPPGYTPPQVDTFDPQLVGVEIDVLNQGKPGVWPNSAKVGLQIVGFGQPNSMAIEVRSEDTDKDVRNRRGLFESGIYFKNSLADYGRLVVADLEQARIGLDFSRCLFREGAAKLRSQQIGTGIQFNDGDSGEVYGGLRWPDFEDKREWLTLRAGTGGVRIVSNDNTRELLAIDNYGGIYLYGDLYLNNKLLNPQLLGSPESQPASAGSIPIDRDTFFTGLTIVAAAWLALVALYLRLARQVAALRGTAPPRERPAARGGRYGEGLLTT